MKMPENSSNAKETAVLIRQTLFPDNDELQELESFDELHQRLSLIIGTLLQNNYQDLLNILYRIDVSENKFREALSTNESANIPSAIASLIIERMLEKVRFRKKYSEEK